MTRLPVAGGAGFVGVNFVHYTGRHFPWHEITAVDALTHASQHGSLDSIADA
ncbi:hypothetical protein AB0M36_07670 [Actinoplanes sp. NPDC051346]|uniref:hypothetical protein n=1 Tax=Actinoplanes sp. NPDC051346 TaxID=3155048 RepID=UPI0034441018